MDNEQNLGVRCNVTECMHNCDGCKCNKQVIDVSHGNSPMENGIAPHYCKSFCEREGC